MNFAGNLTGTFGRFGGSAGLLWPREYTKHGKTRLIKGDAPLAGGAERGNQADTSRLGRR